MTTNEEILKEHEEERTKCDVYSRAMGYIRPINQYNIGKRQEFEDRKSFEFLLKNAKSRS